MARKNRELQRVPSEEAQRAALRLQAEYGPIGARYRMSVSDDPIYGLLRAQLMLLADADEFVPKSARGPKPKRANLLRILDVLEARGWPINTGKNSRIPHQVAGIIGRSPEQTADLLHQLQDMAETLKIVEPSPVARRLT